MISHPSPIIVWFLLAATLAVDAVAVHWMAAAPRSYTFIAFFMALANAQISIVAIASVFAEVRSWCRWCAPFAVALAPAAILFIAARQFRQSVDAEFLITAIVIFELHALAVVGALLIIRQFRTAGRRWQFSLWHVLVIMALAAVFITAVQSTELVERDWYHLAVMITSSVLVAVAALIAHGVVGFWLLRLGAFLATALFVGWGLNLAQLVVDWRAFNLVQAVVLWPWLQWGGFIPTRNPAQIDPSQPASASGTSA